MRRRLSALSSFYRYCAAHDLVDRIPTAGVARPVVDPDYTATIGLDRDQVRALVAAADADQGPQRAGLRRTQGPPDHPPLRPLPGTAWTATRATR